MDRKVLVIAVALMAVAILATPVMVAPATKVAVTATTVGTASGWEYWLVDHGILQLRGGEGSSVVTVNIPGQAPLIGAGSAEIIGKIKFDHPPPGPYLEAEGHYRAKMVRSFPGGTFEGVRISKHIGYPGPFVSLIETHCVLHGTGDFQGQTLRLSYEGSPPIAWEGYLITSN